MPESVEPNPTYCDDCGTKLNEGEAKCFTVCDICWRAHYVKLSLERGRTHLRAPGWRKPEAP